MEIENLSIQISANARDAIAEIDRLASALRRFDSASNQATNSASETADALNDVQEAANEHAESMERSGQTTRTFADRLRSVTAPLRTFATEIGSGIARSARVGLSAIRSFIGGIARIAKFRIYRTIIKDLGQSFKDLYGYSDAFGIQFAASMDKITTATTYLRNSIAAMFAPIVNALAPVIDYIIDKVVILLNLFNEFFAGLNGQRTFTVAKKVAVDFGDTLGSTAKQAKKATDEIKRTILGFDEINKLTKPRETSTSSGSGSSPYSDNYKMMFEERPVRESFKQVGDFVNGIKEKIENATSGWPDWLKWLLGIGTVAIAGWGIKQLPKLIGKILSGLKDLALVKLPSWLSKLFSGKNPIANDGKFDVDVDLEKGDWSVLDELKDETALVKVGLQHWGWDNIQDYIGTAATVAVGLKHWGWENINDWIGNAVTVAVALKHWGWGTLSDWIGNAVTVAVGLRHWGWENINDWIGNAVTVMVALRRWGWNSIEDWIGDSITVAVGLSHWGWTTIEEWIGPAVTVHVGLRKWGWDSLQSWIGDDEVTIKVNLVMNQSSASNVESLADGFGGATGGGGKTSGGGAGRKRHGTSFGGSSGSGTSLWDNIVKATSTAWGNIQNIVNTALGNIDKESQTVFPDITSDITTAWVQISTWTTATWNSVKNLSENTWTSMKNSATSAFDGIKTAVVTAWSGVNTWTTSTWNSIKNNAANVWDNLKTNASTTFSSIQSNIKDAWSNIQRSFGSFVSWVGRGFYSDWGTAWSGIVERFGNVFAKIKDKVKDPINAVIKFLNKMINKVESAINKIVSGINRALSISIPAMGFYDFWGNWIGTNAWSWSPNLPTVSWGRIDELARGGILDSPTMLTPNVLAGEAGREAVLPLENHTEWMDTLANKVRNGISGQDGNLAESVRQGMSDAVSRQNDLLREQNRLLQQLLAKDMTVEVTSTAINKAQNRMNKRAGTTIVPVGT
jgi:hypothetical protein